MEVFDLLYYKYNICYVIEVGTNCFFQNLNHDVINEYQFTNDCKIDSFTSHINSSREQEDREGNESLFHFLSLVFLKNAACPFSEEELFLPSVICEVVETLKYT